MAAMADLMRDAQSMSEEQLQIARFKIEDGVFSKFEIEIEHLIQLGRDIQEPE
jgi:hypothetical protein